MAASDMMSALMELSLEKHIDQLYLTDRLEQSLAKEYAEIPHLEWGAKVTIDHHWCKITPTAGADRRFMDEEEGNFTEFEGASTSPPRTRAASLPSTQAEINAIVRNPPASRSTREFSGRIGDLISGTVLQSTPDFTIVQDPRGRRGRASALRPAPLRERTQRASDGRALPAQPAHQGRDHRRSRPQLQPAAGVRGEHSRPPIVISRTHLLSSCVVCLSRRCPRV